MLNVAIADRQSALKLNRALIRKLARAAGPEHWSHSAVSIAVVDDAAITDLNSRYLGKARPTDVLAFPLDDVDASDRPLIGEVVVSAERAAEEAAARGLRPEEELALYVVHGILHLCGYDDHDAAGRRAMRAREAEILAAFGLRRTGSRARSSS